MGLFPPAPEGGKEIAYGYKGKGVVLHLLADSFGNPLAISTTPANASERLQVKILLQKANIHPRKSMPILEADKGYDSFWLRNELLKLNIFPYIPYKKNSSKAKEFKEKFKTKSIRWKVERTFAWIKRKCRRLFARWERTISAWQAFVTLGVIFMWMENLVR
jgi:transposase